MIELRWSLTIFSENSIMIIQQGLEYTSDSKGIISKFPF